MTKKQELFCREYLVDLNATQAAIRAGYSADTAANIGWENVRKPEIADRINRLMNERAARLELSADRVLFELARLAYANMAEYMRVTEDGSAVVDLSNLTPDKAAAIQEIISEVYMEGRGDNAVPVKRTKLKLHPRCQALDLLGKHFALFTDRHELTGSSDINVRVKLVDAGDGDS